MNPKEILRIFPDVAFNSIDLKTRVNDLVFQESNDPIRSKQIAGRVTNTVVRQLRWHQYHKVHPKPLVYDIPNPFHPRRKLSLITIAGAQFLLSGEANDSESPHKLDTLYPVMFAAVRGLIDQRISDM